MTGGSLTGHLSSSDYLLGTGLIRVNASGSTSNFGYIKAETYDTNRSVVHIGSNYGGSSAISNSVSYDAIGIYRTCVGIGGTFTGATLKSNYDAGIKLDVSGNVKATKFIGALQGNVTGTASGNLPLSGGALTGNISYQGTNAVNSMIRFLNNTSDAYGNGISIGGGGAVIIGGGEAASTCESLVAGGDEITLICSDQNIEFYSNCQSGTSTAKKMTYNTSGQLTAANFITSSDKRLKTNIHEISNAKKSLDLNFYEFDYKDNDNHSAGHIAQEVKEVLPKFVHEDKDEEHMLSIDYTGLHSIQIKALLDRIIKLEEEIKILKSSK